MKAAYGMDSEYGSQMKTPEQKALEAALGGVPEEGGGGAPTTEQQKQTAYANDNGMAESAAQKASTAQQGTTAADQFGGATAQTSGGFTPAASPVTPDGQIRATTQEQYQAPVPAPAPAQATGTGQGTSTATQQFAGNAAGVQGTLPQAPNAGVSAYGNYPARPENTAWTANTSLVPPAYQATQFQQAAQIPGIEQMQMQALEQAFAGNPLNTEAMKARLREDAMAMAGQAQDQVGQNAAGRGTFGGGNQLAMQSDINSQAISDILGGYRDIDIAAADRKQADLLNAIAAGGGMAQDMYGRNLGFQQAQAAENLGANQSALQNALAINDLTRSQSQSNLQNYQTDLDAYFQKLGIDTSKWQTGINADLTREGYATDLQKAKMAQLVNLLQLAQGAWSDENQLGYNYTALGQGALQNALGGF